MNLNTFNAMYILYKVQPSTLSRSQLYAYQCQLLSPHALSAQCTPSMFCSFDEHCANVSIMSVAAILFIRKARKNNSSYSANIFFEYIPPWFDVKSPPPLKFFLEHLLQAFYGVDAPVWMNEERIASFSAKMCRCESEHYYPHV